MKFIKTKTGFKPLPGDKQAYLTGILTIFLVKMYTFVMVGRFIVGFLLFN